VPEVAAQVQFSWLTRYEAFDFTPLTAQLDDLATDELPSEVTQPLSKVRTCVAQLALRLNTLRAAIIEARSALDRQLGAGTVLAATSALLPAWIPPDLSALVSEEPCSLQDYTFVSEAEGESDTIAVSERLELGGLHLCALVERARLDWIALCWLCWGAGLDRVELPPQLVPRAAYGRALATAFQRVWRSRDRLQSLGLLARKQGVPSFTWHGAAVETLSPQWARAARDQYLEMRAALYFLGDETCRSLWQDDLRV
jgi:hypothetical protein